ncbi:hypothetical protein D3C72_1588540 [compost metagenome]
MTTVGTTTAVQRAVGTGAVPGHTDKERTIVAIVRWPPVLRLGQGCFDVLFHRTQVKTVECLGIVEIGVGWAGGRVVLSQQGKIQAIGPPVLVSHLFVLASQRGGAGVIGVNNG